MAAVEIAAERAKSEKLIHVDFRSVAWTPIITRRTTPLLPRYPSNRIARMLVEKE